MKVRDIRGLVFVDGKSGKKTLIEKIAIRYEDADGFQTLSLQAGNVMIQVPAKDIEAVMK